MNGTQTIAADVLAQKLEQQQADLIDVRTPMEFQAVHAAEARNVPLDVLDPRELMKSRHGSAQV